MTQNIATGCTVMLNHEAVACWPSAREPPQTLHDWWAYLLVTAAGGQVLADDTATVLYRQHANNAVGVPLSRAAAAGRRYGAVPARSCARLPRASGGAAGPAGPADAATRETLGLIAAGLHDGWAGRVRAVSHPGLKRQRWAETQLFRLWFLLG